MEEKKTARRRGADSARVVQVIETLVTVGRGDTIDDPVRVVRQYWSLDGELLWVNDPAAQS